ncbi:bifunctional 4-hydroxy-2-oxoglutarate aldolase/2-dehydro-3-deoxy-phosphogluconate aldolase [Paenisporosarcina antarctica]|uniref:bifunctional 4-hydroxy-2-oxoglutarate aldolase/2-dehydro-3-deoxy-phosphogluconate aldolase n=1 Tax=Paenisporosarcina antarctica TaxID=417367 RepID=UPI0014170DC3|nr:bifunctional 4-hydroxy-2-oxoglutarate aldolase/2-dehydro-3-deoxy-phosphogluconate aldolase [Paenisporosarcina antarctica]
MNFLKDNPLVPVLRKIPYEYADEIISALYDSGIHIVEITMETERVEEIIRNSVTKFGDKMLIGAGTILSINDCHRAIEAGAQFIVAPVLQEEVIQYAVARGIPMIPGVFTPSEMLRAYDAGAIAVKLFPASSLGPGFVKDVKGPLSHIPIMVTGGIDADNARSYLDAGAIAVGAGSALLDKKVIAAQDWKTLRNMAKEWVEKVH